MKSKKPLLTEQELEIMKIVWRKDSATVRDVYEEMLTRRKIAYTTVMTMMMSAAKTLAQTAFSPANIALA